MMFNSFNGLKNNRFFQDSFWAVFGNGIGNFLMLLSGILIARFLGKDLYGEYGVVKSTMFMMALFATFGLGDTSTKFIAEYLEKDRSQVFAIIRSSFKIVFVFSFIICFTLFFISDWLAAYVKVPHLSAAFRFLGVIIVFRALNTVGAGVLGGLKEYRVLGINNVLGGVVMLLLSIPLSLSFSINGALSALLMSQVVLSLLNVFSVRKSTNCLQCKNRNSYERMLISFSFPFALNEFFYTFCSLGCTLLLTRLSSVGELGIFTACSQWNAIVLFMPGLLGNVILSHLSSTAGVDDEKHERLINRMLLINCLCTVFPLLIVIIFSSVITRFYGPSFATMRPVLIVSILGTVFTCMTRVFQSNLMSEGLKWRAFFIRSTYNVLQLIVTFLVLFFTKGVNGAYNITWVSFGASLLALCMYFIDYRLYKMHNKNNY